ncbi:MAG TPA: EAL domain-containing protein [Acidimicrobiales bacterium]|nr:EAL domain-containing protein [Acidimicrobiales bacterium]
MVRRQWIPRRSVPGTDAAAPLSRSGVDPAFASATGVRRERRLTRLWEAAAVLILVLGSATVTVVTGVWYASNRHHNQTQLEAGAKQIAATIREALDGYADQTASTAALFSQPEPLDHAAFAAYLEELNVWTRYPGLRGLGFISWVPGDDLPGFVAQARSDGLPGFTVSPAGQRPAYCVASYVAVSDLGTSFPLLGYDLCTLPELTARLDLAVASGQEQVVLEDALASGPAYRGNFVLISAVYRGQPTTVAQRQAQLLGWVATLVDGTQLLHHLDATASHLGLALYSGSSLSSRSLVVAVRGGAGPLGPGSEVEHFSQGSRWTAVVRPLPGAPGPADPLLAPGIVFVMALLLNFGMAAFVWDLGRGRVRVVRSLLASERRFQSMASCSPVGILEIADDGATRYFNPRLREIVGVDDDFFETHSWLECVHPDDRLRATMLARGAGRSGGDVAASFRLVRPDGELRHVRVLVAPVTGAGGGLGRFVATVQDVSDEVAATEALAFQALHDHLTGLPNRALFLDRLNLELSGSSRSGGSLAVMFLDLDRFKVINDGLGHQAGDDLLRVVAARLLHVVRSGETVARLGGDEFTFILHGVEGAGAAAVVAQRILDTLASPIEVGGRDVVVTGSIGIVLPGPDASAVAILRDADAAMYRAKEAGRCRFEIFDEEQRSAVVRRLTIESELRRAIERDELRVHYQPLVSLCGNEPQGAEALVRWDHPSRGILLPGEFIPVAEESGLIVPLGEWVFRKAASDCASWDRMEDGPDVRRLAVNVSARQLATPSLSPMVHEALRLAGVAPERITVEVTESVIMSDDDTTRRSLEDLRGLGVSIAIDDFGTGYSSLSSLSNLPVSVVKIDKSFVDQIDAGREGDPIVVAIIEMAHALGLRVVAEGVSREGQRRFLQRCGCDKAQGFLWTPPLPADDFVAWWRAARSASVPGRSPARHGRLAS